MTTEAPEAPTPTPTVQAEAEKARPSLFKYSEWLHVGEGAEDCTDRHTGRCRDEGHFHAYLRLANPYQIEDIMQKAQAAKARRMKMYRDPESDVSVILEDDLDELRAAVEEGQQDRPADAADDWVNPTLAILVDEIIDQDFQEDYARAVSEVDEIEDDSAEPDDDGKLPKLYVNIDQDREEYERQKDLPEEQRAEDFAVLERTVADYSRAIEERMDAIQKPRRDAMMAKPVEELVAVVRRKRVEERVAEVYLSTFNMWQTFVCTYRPAGVKDGNPVTPKQRYFDRIEELRFDTPAEVVQALAVTFRKLELNQARDRAGKDS